MPITLAHPAAVLPLRRFCPRFLSFPALVAGSMAPDAGYCFSSMNLERLSHSFVGVFVFGLPVGLALYWLGGLAWDQGVSGRGKLKVESGKRNLWGKLKVESGKLKVARGESHLWGKLKAESGKLKLQQEKQSHLLATIFVLPFSVLIGALTHLVWDSFTNNQGWTVMHLRLLREPVLSVAGHEVRVCHVLWYGCSFAGVAALCRAYAKWRGESGEGRGAWEKRKTESGEWGRAAFWGALVLPIGAAHHLIGGMAGGLLVALLSAALVVAVVFSTSQAECRSAAIEEGR